MKILMGTTNPSKVKRFREFLEDCDIEFYTLQDLKIDKEPVEIGKTPEENAMIKAKFYGQFFDKVICNDSGLYFGGISLDDLRQPGLNIRTPQGHSRMNDEEMISYYSELIGSLGGKVLAFYLDGIAVFNSGKVYTFMESAEEAMKNSFYMVEKPSELRHDGWPLDSISLNSKTMTYFVEKGNDIYDKTEENIMLGEYRKRIIEFLKESLGIQHKTGERL